MDPEKLKVSTTTDGKPADPEMDGKGAPKPINPATGQHGAYWILTAEERAKGFVRPVRTSYVHAGLSPPGNPLRDLTPEEHERYDKFGYVKFEEYQNSESSVTGRFWTQDQLNKVGKGCNTTTTMSIAISETYARDPHYYGSTFCVCCGTHMPVAEFKWVGTDELVGS